MIIRNNRFIKDQSDELKLTLVGHLTELRKRLIIIIISVIVGMGVSYAFVEQIFELIMVPAKDLSFVYLAPPELFLTYVKISVLVSFIATSPITLSQVWLFLKPGLKKEEKVYVMLSLCAGIVFFALGIVFSYRIILPVTLRFFINIANQNIAPMISIASYISFVNSIMLSFGIVFEMPMLVALLSQLRLITPNTLKRNRKIFILAIFIAAAILTPPDVISQMLLAAPMVLLFEFSILLAVMIDRKHRNRRKDGI